jgi:tetratricopeptide (TPR) repeat protein
LNELAYQTRFADLKVSEKYAEQAIELSSQLKFEKGLVRGLLNEGFALQNQGMHASALTNYIKAIRISQEINDKDIEGDCYNELGNIYTYLKDFKYSLDYHLKALQIRTLLKDEKGISDSNSNIGMVYRH